MQDDGIPSEVQEFIFEHVDSVDQLDVMLLLRCHRHRAWTAKEVSDELRTNPGSAATRLEGLKAIGIVQDKAASPPSYQYSPATPELERIIDGLADACKVRRQRVYGLIFSTLKAARKFLNAFTVQPRKEGDDE